MLPGDYGKYEGIWYGHAPTKGFHCNLANHHVIEHEDGTITVTPSILITRGDGSTWHGYITKGEWKEV